MYAFLFCFLPHPYRECLCSARVNPSWFGTRWGSEEGNAVALLGSLNPMKPVTYRHTITISGWLLYSDLANFWTWGLSNWQSHRRSCMHSICFVQHCIHRGVKIQWQCSYIGDEEHSTNRLLLSTPLPDHAYSIYFWVFPTSTHWSLHAWFTIWRRAGNAGYVYV